MKWDDIRLAKGAPERGTPEHAAGIERVQAAVDDLEELRRLSEAATPGEWQAVLENEYGDYGFILSTAFDGVWTADGRTTIYKSVDDFGTDDYADGLFIVAAVNFVRSLLSEPSR